MATESIREILIERIRELRFQKLKALSEREKVLIEDMIALNLRIYHNIFKGSV